MADVKSNDRKDRLSAALRENLKRRKQQLRGRAGRSAGRADGTAEPAGPDQAGDTEDDTRGNQRE
jgi:hypothetical protein